MISVIGKGSFGEAALAECQSTREKVVIKQIDIRNMTEKMFRETVKEAKILEALNHPNIIRFREVFKTKS